MTFRQKTMAKLGKEPATPGYTGYIPAMRNHLIGHSYGDSTRRAAACTDSLRHRDYGKSIELVWINFLWIFFTLLLHLNFCQFWLWINWLKCHSMLIV